MPMPLRPPRILIVDNYDSYTFNLFQLCTADPSSTPIVVRNDQLKWKELQEHVLPFIDAVVISPGPGRPDREEDFGICSSLLQHASVPILGVCLGHQGLASVFGGKVVTADQPMHGRLSNVHHTGTGLFAGIPNPVRVVRYHSLVVDLKSFPEVLEQTAWMLSPTKHDHASQNIVMAMQHRSKPIWSVQFHPESICTDHGQQMINNFILMAEEHWKQHARHPISPPPFIYSDLTKLTVIPSPLSIQPAGAFGYSALFCPFQIDFVSPERVFDRLYANQGTTFWLDSARVEPGLSRFSYMGDVDGPLAFEVTYSLSNRILTQRRGSRIVHERQLPQQETFFAWMADQMRGAFVSRDRIRIVTPSFNADSRSNNQNSDIECPFIGGFVGYFGYEMKSESLRLHTAAHDDLNKFEIESAKTTPDAAFMFADRVIICDYEKKMVYLSALVKDDDDGVVSAQKSWINDTARALRDLGSETQPVAVYSTTKTQTNVVASEWMTLAHDRDAYISNISSSLEKIKQGETYEVCLTTQLSRRLDSVTVPPSVLYRQLRSRNPAPYGAFLSFDHAGLLLASSSPERFLRLDSDGWLSMKPIKGTRPRATLTNFHGTEKERADEDEKRRLDLETNEKDRSENLMIVDLIRNDINQISEPLTVHVPHLMVVESYATVHQLVSTIKGKLRRDLTAVDAVMRTFPPGSMTGAPKLRTVRILEELERIPRGPYSGVLGFFSVSGPADLSVVIRTAVLNRSASGSTVSIGAGGAIVALSDPADEFDEMLLKANSVVPSLASALS